ncbi:TIGR02206 family membrane protein [Alteribacillus sp. HJP-4]|uniref:YwaF family protein n=1 Tax=Alteribacillus sp. HJP-4 TaxID=2775394 RepID=UPI0035CD1BF6
MFAGDSPYPFEMFSPSHWVAVGIVLLISAFLIYFRRVIRSNPILQKLLRRSLLFLLIATESTYHSRAILTGEWNRVDHLPLELCSLSTFMAIILLCTDNQKLFRIFYFLGLFPAVVAIATPVLFNGFPHIEYFRFFSQHLAIVCTVLFFIFVKNYRPRLRSVFFSFLCLNIISVFIILLNVRLDANYMFLNRPPAASEYYVWSTEQPYYLLNLEVVVFAVFLLSYVPFALRKRNREREGQVNV